ncbi:hypothetical protein KY334_07445 [Candidatus Woesearchaeota archaeon]|nr:hypothetical protein [Candidatus Woesearchaeota archaeon]
MSCNCLNRDLVEKEIYKELINQINSYGDTQNFCTSLLQLLDRLGFDVDEKLIHCICFRKNKEALNLIKEKL